MLTRYFGGSAAVATETPSGAVTSADFASLRDINLALGAVWDAFEKTPKVINNDADEAQEAIREFQHAAPTSLDRCHQLYGSAQPHYNAGLTGIY